MLVVMGAKTIASISAQEQGTLRSAATDALAWLNTNWHCAGAVAGLFYVCMMPLHGRYTPASLLLALQMPIYIIHQLEEHVYDRFRLDVNRTIGGGFDVLPHSAVIVINVLGVWGMEWLALYLAAFVHPGFAMLAFFLAIVNGITHTAGALVQRVYNPGLITALVLLIPGGVAGIYCSARTQRVWSVAAVLSLILILAEHVCILAYVLRRKRRLASATRLA